MRTIPRTVHLADVLALRRRLAWLRRQGRFISLCRGLRVLLGLAGAGITLLGVLDWRWHLPGPVRGAGLALLLISAGIVLLRHLISPLRQPADDLSLALRIEEAHLGLNDSLASAVQFLQQ